MRSLGGAYAARLERGFSGDRGGGRGGAAGMGRSSGRDPRARRRPRCAATRVARRAARCRQAVFLPRGLPARRVRRAPRRRLFVRRAVWRTCSRVWRDYAMCDRARWRSWKRSEAALPEERWTHLTGGAAALFVDAFLGGEVRGPGVVAPSRRSHQKPSWRARAHSKPASPLLRTRSPPARLGAAASPKPRN